MEIDTASAAYLVQRDRPHRVVAHIRQLLGAEYVDADMPRALRRVFALELDRVVAWQALAVEKSLKGAHICILEVDRVETLVRRSKVGVKLDASCQPSFVHPQENKPEHCCCCCCCCDDVECKTSNPTRPQPHLRRCPALRARCRLGAGAPCSKTPSRCRSQRETILARRGGGLGKTRSCERGRRFSRGCLRQKGKHSDAIACQSVSQSSFLPSCLP